MGKKYEVDSDEVYKSLAIIDEVKAQIETQGSRPPVGFQSKSSSAEELAFSDWFRKGIIGPSEAKVLTIASDPSAGYMVPAQLSSEIISALTEGDTVRKVARVMQTSNNSLEVLKKSASGAVVKQATETALIAATTGLAFDKLTFTPEPLVYLLQVGNDFLADSAISVDSFMTQELGEAFGTYDAAAHTAALIANCGDGTLNTYKEKHGGSTTAITADSIINLTYELPTRFLANAKFMMNRTTLAYIRTIKDAVTGAYMWFPAWAALGGGASAVETLCGYPIVVNDNMPAMTSALYPILFGDFSKGFAVVDRNPGFSVQRLAERYAEYSITAFLARFRTTSGPLVGEALVAYQMST
jgi:HK97 family phage major capsid protein